MKQADQQIIRRLNEIYDAQAAGGAASFASLTGDPSDNAALGSALDAKQTEAQVQTIADAKVESEAYGPTWNGDTTHAPAKNDVYDKIEAVVASIPPAHSGGVIGTAVLSIDNADAVTVVSAFGVLSGLQGDIQAIYNGSTGVLMITFPAPLGDPEYFPNFTVDAGTGATSVTASLIESDLSTTGFNVVFKDSMTGSAAGTTVNNVRITILKLSQ